MSKVTIQVEKGQSYKQLCQELFEHLTELREKHARLMEEFMRVVADAEVTNAKAATVIAESQKLAAAMEKYNGTIYAPDLSDEDINDA